MSEEISEDSKERYRKAADLVHISRGKDKHEYNERAKTVIAKIRETLELDDEKLFVLFSSIAYMASTLMISPLATVSNEIETIFDTYTLAAGGVLGVVDLNDETPAPTKEEATRKAMIEEIERLRSQLSTQPSPDDNTGLYL